MSFLNPLCRRALLCGWGLFLIGAFLLRVEGKTPTAANPPVILPTTLVPENLSERLKPYTNQVQDALWAIFRAHPNVRIHSQSLMPYPAGAPMPPSERSTEIDYALYARLLREVPADSSPEPSLEVALYLYDYSTLVERGVWRFRSKRRELAQHLEIAVESLFAPILRLHLGILRLEMNEPPMNVQVDALPETIGKRTLPPGLFRVYPLPEGKGVEMLSRPLLKGEYEVSVEFSDRPVMTQRVQVVRGERAQLTFNTATTPPLTTTGATASLLLTTISPEQVVYLEREDGGEPFALYFYRMSNDQYVHEWTRGAKAVREGLVFRAGDGPAAVLLTGIPQGRYTVGTWARQVRTVGKTLFSGTGLKRTITVQAGGGAVSLALPKRTEGLARLNLFWKPFGPPQGGRLYVNHEYVGEVFDSGELSVLDLAQGEHQIRFEARGFQPFEKYVWLREGRETSLFVLFEPLTRE